MIMLDHDFDGHDNNDDVALIMIMACEDVLEKYLIMLDHDFDGHDNNHDVAVIMIMSL